MSSAGFGTRDDLDRRLAECEECLTRRIVALLGVQIVMFSLITKFL